MAKCLELLRALPAHHDEAGATAVEYALLLALIAAVIIPTVALVAPALVPGFQAVIGGLP